MAFQVFKPSVSRSGRGEIISITKRGSLNFNRMFSRQHLASIQFVELYFDEENHRVGIKPLNEKTENAYKLGGRTGKWVRVKDFLEFYRCGHSKTTKYKPQWNEAHQLFEIQI
jgi:hypothetical protein